MKLGITMLIHSKDDHNSSLNSHVFWDTLYNKAKIHSINTSKGYIADVGVFSDNAKVTVYKFL